MEVLLLFRNGEVTSITCFLVFNKGYMYMIKLSVAICTVFKERPIVVKLPPKIINVVKIYYESFYISSKSFYWSNPVLETP